MSCECVQQHDTFTRRRTRQTHLDDGDLDTEKGRMIKRQLVRPYRTRQRTGVKLSWDGDAEGDFFLPR